MFIFLGDDEEKKSFRSKGIPVIFQDELEEKPDIGNKSPIILKYEKPPLLPHHNKDGEFLKKFYFVRLLDYDSIEIRKLCLYLRFFVI